MSTISRDILYTVRWHLSKGDLAGALAVVNEQLGDNYAASSFPSDTKAIEVPWLVAPPQPFPIVGRAFLRDRLPGYLVGVSDRAMNWTPKGITIHHCSSPSLADRPAGFVEQHMLNLRSYYHGQLGWSSGPHFFVDDDQCWAFSPVTGKGVHAKSFNATHIGIEMLGDYDREDPFSGRGLQVLKTAAWTCKALMKRFGLSLEAINFHRDDPKTDKTCPGSKVLKPQFIQMVKDA